MTQEQNEIVEQAAAKPSRPTCLPGLCAARVGDVVDLRDSLSSSQHSPRARRRGICLLGSAHAAGIPPHKLAYNMKLPGTYAAYALIMAVFGQTTKGIRMGLLLVNLATIFLVFCWVGVCGSDHRRYGRGLLRATFR